MRVNMVFKLPEEQEEYELAMNGSKAAAALEDIKTYIFRPYRKHGYHNEAMQTLLNRSPDVGAFMSLLEKELYTLLESYQL